MLKDNCVAHETMDRLLNSNLSHVKVIYLLPNTTPAIQALHAGIIAALKFRYRDLQAGRVLDLNDLRSDDTCEVGILQGIRWIIFEWMTLLSALKANCWRKTLLVCTTSNGDAKVKEKMEEGRQALTLEVAETVSEEDNC